MEKKKKDLLKNFSELFHQKMTQEEIIPDSDLKGYLDLANVMMVIPKTNKVRDLIIYNFDVQEKKIPSLDYQQTDLNKINTVKISSVYLKVALELTKHDDVVEISVKNDYPMTLETKYIKIIIGPRIDSNVNNNN